MFRTRIFPILFLFSSILGLPLQILAEEAAQNLLPDGLSRLAGKRVLWLGDSITYAGGYVADVEYYLSTQYPTARFDFINAGLGSETVSGLSEPNHAGGKFPRPNLFERLDRVLDQVQPELVVACYGMNCGIYLPLNEERFSQFRKGTIELHENVTSRGAKIIHLTPPVYDDRGEQLAYSETLDEYSRWLIQQRDAAGWDVIDVHFPMKQYLEEQREIDPDFRVQRDRVHPDATGHWVIARAVLQSLGAEDLDEVDDLKTLLSQHPNGVKIHFLINDRTRVLRDAWLTATKHLRPGVRAGLPMEQAMTKAQELDEEIDRLRSANQKTSNVETADQP